MPEKMKNAAVNYSTMATSDIVNTVRRETIGGAGASGIDFNERLPECVKENVSAIGEIFMQNPMLANAFLTEIMNRIGLVDMNYRRYENNLKDLKEGRLEFGDTVEEIAFGLVKAKCDYKVEDGITDVFQITKPEVASAIHKINYEVKYPGSISRVQLRKAFTGERSLGSFIDGIITSIYNSYEVDEQLSYKNLIVRSIQKGFAKVETIQPIEDEASGKKFIKTVKALSTKMRFMSKEYSYYGLPQFTPESDMIIILDAELDAEITVDVWAAAFNMSEVDFIRSGRKIVVDDFGVEGLRAILADKRFFQIYDVDLSMDTIYNPSNRVYNYFLHVQEVLSASPFMQAVAFVEEGSGSLTALEVTPPTATVQKGETVEFKVDRTGTGLYDGAVAWSVSGAGPDSLTTITPAGLLKVDKNETASELTVTAAAVYAENVNSTATVTVTA